MSPESQQDIDLTSCEREPIHIPGSIQPYGCLIACDLVSWIVTHVSETVANVLGVVNSRTLLGLSLDQVLSGKVVHDLRNTLQASMVSGTAETLADVTLEGQVGPVDIAVHVSDQHAIVEILPRSALAPSGSPLTIVRSMVGRLKRAPTLERALIIAANQVRAVTGFDRVMIYKFLDDESGQVIAEAVRSGLTPFLGLHYPASDIPAQARALYKRQRLRLIPDVAYKPSALLCAGNGAEAATLDLSLAVLRSVSPVHIEYLQNMGSHATLTISIIIGDRLWGLISCHHEVPRALSTSTCAAVDVFGQILSLQIEAKEQERELSYIAMSRKAHERLTARMVPDETLFANLGRYSDLLMELIPADGIGVWTAGVFSGVGVVPPVEAMPDLVAFLATKDAHEVYAISSLAAELPSARAYKELASGLIAIPFPSTPRDYLLFFRREVLQFVNWGGDPNKAVSLDDGRLGPRKSFAAWREQVSGRARPWQDVELKIAGALRTSLLDLILRRAYVVDRERRTAQDSQALLVAELNHRVKNILALIRSLLRQSKHNAQSVAAFTDDLENRVKALAVAHDQLTMSGWTAAPLRRLLETEAEAWARSPKNGIVFEGPSVLLDSRAYHAMALVFHELMTNAAKHGSLVGETGVLSVVWAIKDDGDLEILWHEEGGPPVLMPSHRGFGSVVIEQTVPFELRGEAHIEYPSEGMRARFLIPRVHVSLGEDAPRSSAVAVGDAVDLRGKRLLVVEDSMMIALDAQSGLQDGGAVVELAGSVPDALRAVDVGGFDAILLDINLAGETSFGIADRCIGLSIPFVFATGYGESVIVPERFRHVPVVAKPYDETKLRAALGIAAEAGHR